MNTYEHLFTPIKIGNTTVKNRIFMPPLSTNLADKGYVTDALVKHYAARAKGGVGLIVTEVTTVEPTYTYLPGDMSIYDDSYIPGWKKLVDAVHQYDTKILSQLFHPAYMAFPIPGTPQLIAPSNVGPYYAKSAPREVTKEELKVIVKQFGEAALRFKKAGGDGVEIQAAHAHGLLGGFLTPLYNKRTDEYGGDIHGRLRLTLEVIEEVRKHRQDVIFIFNHRYFETKTGASFYLGARHANSEILEWDGDLLVHPDDVKMLLDTEGEFICYSDKTSDDAVFVRTDEQGTVLEFSRESGDYEWTGPACICKRNLVYSSQNVFNMFESHLPMRGIKVRAYDIDTYNDYLRVSELTKDWKI